MSERLGHNNGITLDFIWKKITFFFFFFIVAAALKQFFGLRVEKGMKVCSSYSILYELWSVYENENSYLLWGIIVDLLTSCKFTIDACLIRLFTDCWKRVFKWFPVWADTGNISIHAELVFPATINSSPILDNLFLFPLTPGGNMLFWNS